MHQKFAHFMKISITYIKQLKKKLLIMEQYVNQKIYNLVKELAKANKDSKQKSTKGQGMLYRIIIDIIQASQYSISIHIFSISFPQNMHQICDGYNPNVRMGNWFEESYSVPQLARTNPTKLSRDTQIDIGYLDAQLKLRPLNRMARLPPWNTSGLVQAPQYKDYHNKTTTKENFDLRTTEHYFNRWKPNVYDKCNGSSLSNQTYIKVNQYKKQYKMFNDQTVKELLNERTSDSSSFRSEIVPNRHVNQKALLQTIYQRDISENAQKIPQKDQEKPYPEASQSNFRRIRSEITLKNVPPFQTYK